MFVSMIKSAIELIKLNPVSAKIFVLKTPKQNEVKIKMNIELVMINDFIFPFDIKSAVSAKITLWNNTENIRGINIRSAPRYFGKNISKKVWIAKPEIDAVI